jgi:hypothetical protein
MAAERRILKSWKDIASYLGVGIRTAQRWKDERGLPVRQPGAARSAVLALPDEIDRWLHRNAGAEAPEVEIPELEGVIATKTFLTRPAHPLKPGTEVECLLELGRLMAANDPARVLARISAYALELCRAESAGFSLVEPGEDGGEIFRWSATAGRMRPYEGGTTPADFSPCGICLQRNAAQLFKYPEKHYPYLARIAPITELLLIPMHEEASWVGTIWVISHHSRRRFDPGDARLLANFGRLASAAIVAATRARARR